MLEYNNKFPSNLTAEQRKALIWRIEDDYLHSGMSMQEPKDYFIRLAIKFYIRNEYSLADIIDKYRAHRRSQKRSMIRMFRAEDSLLATAS
jgi:hypothetical protein